MIDDPWKVLGIEKGASQDEIKKAYRRKAKEYHPDLNQDPDATQKMSEVNEAYQLLMNPEAWEAKKAQQAREQQARSAGTQQGPYQQYSGPEGWASGFDFNDFFGFGFGGYGYGQTETVQPQAGDSQEFRRVIDLINSRQFQAAASFLTGMVSELRNARWHYLYAMANEGMGNRVQALEEMRRAAQYDPNNILYRQTLQRYEQMGQVYQQNQSGAGMSNVAGKICLGLCAAQMLCSCCPYGCGGYYGM